MYSFINYLFQVSILSIVFIALYLLVFRKQTNFKINRFYIISGLVISWLIPLINIPLFLGTEIALPQIQEALPTESFVSDQIVNDAPVFTASAGTETMQNTKAPFQWLNLYWLGAAFVLIRSLLVLAKIFLLRYKNQSTKIKSVRVISGYNIPAFSFFKWVFINEKQLESSSKELILAHEFAHSNQKHSLDLVLVEIIHILLWFNPFIILYKKALKESHEFLADKAVLDSGVQLTTYARSLQNELFTNKYQKLASYFKGSTLKRRMIMATKASNRRYVWSYLLAIPLVFLALTAFSYINDPIEIDSVIGSKNDKFTVLIDPAHGGEDLGSSNDSLGVYEKDILLGIAKYLKKETPKDFKIILTRDNDEFISQNDRIQMAGNPDIDMVISLQITSYADSSKLGGYSSSYSPLNAYSDQSRKLANWFTESYLHKGSKAQRAPQQAPEQILSKAECPGFIVSWGNLSNASDTKYLSISENQKDIAKNLHESISFTKMQIEANFPEGKIEKFEAKRKFNSFSFPLKKEDIVRISSYFRPNRRHPILKVLRPHTGIDFTASRGTDVHTTDRGFVKDIKINKTKSGFGTYILLEHYNGFESFYGHLDECFVSIGDEVKGHQIIGKVGLTGLTVAPHLHFEIRKDGKAINPINFLSPGYDKMEEINIGMSGKKPKLKASKVYIFEFLSVHDMIHGQRVAIDNVEIKALGKKYYLIVQNSQARSTYAYELLKNGKDLYLTTFNPNFANRSLSYEGIEAFEIENGEIVGPKRR